MTNLARKCSSDQSFILKRITSYKIHTLGGLLHLSDLIQLQTNFSQITSNLSIHQDKKFGLGVNL